MALSRRLFFFSSRVRPLVPPNGGLLRIPLDLSKPLSRASASSYNRTLVAQQRQQRKMKQRKMFITLAHFSVYYYHFPKIPRPHRNMLYYSLASSSTLIAGSIRHFSTFKGSRNGAQGVSAGAKFLSSTRKRLFDYGRRRLATASGRAPQLKLKRQRRFRNFFTLTTIAIIFFGVVSRYEFTEYDDEEEVDEETVKKQSQRKRQVIRPTNVLLYLYSRLPLNALSRLWGQFNSVELPLWLREPGFKFYARVFGVNMDEMVDPELKHYHNLSEFFYRRIRPETRPVDPDAQLCSPCDGRIIKLGLVKNGEIEQVKGMTYELEALLGTTNSKLLAEPCRTIEYPLRDSKTDVDTSRFLKDYEEHDHSQHVNELVKYEEEGDVAIFHPSVADVVKISSKLYRPRKDDTHKLYYAVIYLDPGDYHHFHSPANWVATTRRHFAGELYSVAPYFQRTFNNLFVLNERVALLGYWTHGFFSMTPVGATNVGSIRVNFDKDLSTNIPYKNVEYPEEGNQSLVGCRKRVKKNTCYEATYSKASKILEGQPLFKGEEMGGFMLGSTVVLCFEAPAEFAFKVKEGDHVKVGERFGYFGSK
ncbi:DEKNAAC101832 [Brettanomyces naardenensis]|uniref:Phosphatidylserine decarboxylase proenzyme 1, mitochondrial n=1 Tax=Brettanomyces naardenensis TaxID=13370 RepID=A0A448YJ71_BRENA|nr:DEKNAAC101832 [Brettanomyces naardenensis]